MKPQRKCKQARCRKLIDFDKTYCSDHIPKREYSKDEYWERKEKDGRYFEFYRSKAWRDMASLHKIRIPYCEDCMDEGIIRKPDVTDHVVEIRDDWSKRLDEDSLRNLCHFHHNRKTRREQERRKKENTNIK